MGFIAGLIALILGPILGAFITVLINNIRRKFLSENEKISGLYTFLIFLIVSIISMIAVFYITAMYLLSVMK